MDMKEIVEFLQQKGIVFKSLKKIPPKEIGSRKRIGIYLGVDLQGYYALVLTVEKKSRVLRKEAETFIWLHEKLEHHIQSKIKNKYILIRAPLCSKAKALLEKEGWSVFELKNP